MLKQMIALAPHEYSAPLQVIGVRITVLASRDATQSHEITLQEGPEGVGPPPHSHAWDESFYVLRGSVECVLGDRPVRATPGYFLHVPAGTRHAFRFGPEGGALLEIAGPDAAATALFEHLDREVPPGPPDLAKVAGILRDHGVVLAG